MKTLNRILIISLVGLIIGCKPNQAKTERILKNKIDSIYNFKPRLLTDNEMQEKSKSLDDFWKLIQSDTSKYLKELRKELEFEDHNPFFYFDGGSILINFSPNNTDKQIAANAFSKTDIKDLSQISYVWTINKLAADQIDVTEAALKILSDTSFSFYVPAHAMTFNQGYCLTYCLLPLDPKMYINKLISEFNKTKEVQTQLSIITTIWFTYSCEGDEFLKSISEKKSLPKRVSEYAMNLLANTEIPKEATLYYKAVTKEDLIEIRNGALARFTDEAIDELDFVAKTWREKYKCR